jgi:ABC-type polar amino acid transport system ATPase subunit
MQFVRDIMDQVIGYDRGAAMRGRKHTARQIAEATEARQQALEAIEKVGLRRPGPLRDTE